MRSTSTALVAAGAIAAIGLVGCGGSNSSTSSTTSASVAEPAPASGCGSFAAPAPKDPDGVVAALPQDQQAAFAGFPVVRKSAWADWKPAHEPPYDVDIIWGPLNTDFQRSATDALQAALKKSPDIGSVRLSSTATLDIGQEIALMNQAIERKPDLIVLEPLTAPAFATQIKRAGETGIPTLLVLDSFDSPYVVNVGANNFLAAADSTSYMLRSIGGKGNLLSVHGLAGSTPDNEEGAGVGAVLKHCPNVKKVGDVYGQFVPAAAKNETLKYLATHPGQVDAVFQTAGMAPGIMQAFQQTGRQVPPVVDISQAKGSLGYWLANRDSYHGIGAGLGGASYGEGLANVAERMLRGEGLKTNSVIQRLPLITDKTLDQWAQPGWTLTTPGIAEGPKGAFLADAYLDPFFTNGAAPKS